MFGKRITLFKLLGFEVRVDISWIVIAVLITWSLAKGFFPYYYPDLSETAYWWMGIAGAMGLFLSVVLHELSHSLVARRYGLTMKGITLFIFGGVAEMPEEPHNPKTEFLMAVAGPASSLALGAVFYGLRVLGGGILSVYMDAVLWYLALINVVLAVFNMLPAFPLDGGRVFRAALWKWKNNIKWATRTASRIGSFFGLLIIFTGIMNIVYGNLTGGIWWFLIGMFLRNASEVSYKQLMTREALSGESVEHFMVRDPVSAPPSLSVQELVDDYIYRHHFKMFPVAEDGNIAGCITTRQIKEIPREAWSSTKVGDIARECSGDNTVSPDEDAVKAMSIMNQTGNSRLMVVDRGKLVGVITLKDILRFLSVKVDLEGE
jgi:Zn-dependent protease/CBS domain-containing protein